MALWKYTLAGIDLDDYQALIVGVNGLEGRPGRRGTNVTVPYRHGVFTSARKFYQTRLGVLTVRVFDTNDVGAVTDGDGRWAHAEINLDRFKELLHAYSTVTLRKTLADETETRDLAVEFLGDVLVQQLDPSRGVFDVTAPFEAAAPFWESTAASSATWSALTAGTAVTVSVGGNAPVGDMVFTVVANGATGLSVQVDGDGVLLFPGTAAGTVVVDVGGRTVRDGAGAGLAGVVDVDRSYWVEFTAGTTNAVDVTLTAGTASVSVLWNDKWF